MNGARVEEMVPAGTCVPIYADPVTYTARRGFRGGSAPRANTVGDGS
jgi:hypothetical protein